MSIADTALQSLVARHRFLRLSDSQTLFPGSAGTGLPLLQVVTDKCHAVIALQGAHLLTFQALDKPALLWLSPNCDFTPGKALRGGVPICLPWFGPHPTDTTNPKHGFVRNSDWTLTDAQLLANGDCELLLSLSSKGHPHFPQAFDTDLRLTLGETISLTLSITNRDQHSAQFTWALHSYHPVDNLAQTRVEGLDGKTYKDNLDGLKTKTQDGDVRFDGEVDRVFPMVENALHIRGNPSIQLTHENCPSVIVWNPGAQNAAAIADIGAGNEQQYICVERGAVHEARWELEPGETRQACLTMSYSG